MLIDRQALHASFLSFRHPVTNQRMELEAPLPDDMRAAAEKNQISIAAYAIGIARIFHILAIRLSTFDPKSKRGPYLR
jgi:hypothetical protein